MALSKPQSIREGHVRPAAAPLVHVDTVSSGYAGSRTVVGSTTISLAIERMENGLKVYDASGEKVGRVCQYVAGSDWFVVKTGDCLDPMYGPTVRHDMVGGLLDGEQPVRLSAHYSQPDYGTEGRTR
jgi:hypothetical protein